MSRVAHRMHSERFYLAHVVLCFIAVNVLIRGRLFYLPFLNTGRPVLLHRDFKTQR